MIRTERAHLNVAANTHPGMTGKNNEDRFAVSAYRISRTNPTPALVAVLCDGIGGHRAGEVAAEMAVDTISHILAISDTRHPQDTMRAAIHQASQRIHDHAQSESARQGMGATCALAWIIGERLYTASVGDSRIYLISGTTIQQVTTDHTWVQEALDHGAITRDQVKSHPNAHVIRRYLGSATPPEVDFRLRLSPEETNDQLPGNQGTMLKPGDILLMCSDGLTDLVEDSEILSALQSQTPDAAIQALIDMANDRGGHDNITIITLGVPTGASPLTSHSPSEAGLAWLKQGSRRYFVLGCLSVAALAGLVIILLLAFDILSWQPRPTPTITATTPPAVQATQAVKQAPSPTVTFTTSPTPAPTRKNTPIQPPTQTPTPWPTSAAPSSTPTETPTDTAVSN